MSMNIPVLPTPNAELNKASLLLADLAKLDGLKTCVRVDRNKVILELDFATLNVSQKVGNVIAEAINGSKQMNKVRRSVATEIKQILNGNLK